eukprot:comp15032_c0_seq1/m.11652 comp15032_c0_seq1/g.11652  ORF comp15032_c0_seq1/g.11652 comp15032_c0_seq1/m.11652 type:complete len:276 (-) comp15032_c0_seq1:326-1153(-)
MRVCASTQPPSHRPDCSRRGWSHLPHHPPDPLFGAWLHVGGMVQRPPRHPNPTDGSVFIDRSPVLFEYVLEFLRTGGVHSLLPSNENAKERLQDEFEFFCLQYPGKEPSILDLCLGEPQCVVLDHTFLLEDCGVQLSSELNRELAERTGDDTCVAILWDTTTGEKLKTWPEKDDVFGDLTSIFMYQRSTHVVGFYERGQDETVVLYSLVDGSMEKSVPLSTQSSMRIFFRNDTLIVRTTDCVIYVQSMATGDVLWQMTPDVFPESFISTTVMRHL